MGVCSGRILWIFYFRGYGFVCHPESPSSGARDLLFRSTNEEKQAGSSPDVQTPWRS
jgi:hypothetical protein